MYENLSRKERRQLQKIEAKQKKVEMKISTTKSKIRSWMIWIVVCLVVASLALRVYPSFRSNPHEFDALAKCLTEKGVVMYGAYWCSHCQEQKKAFRDSFEFITYMECASPEDPQKMTAQCKAAGISGYPTWIFPGNVKLGGEQTLEKLSKVSECPLK